MKSLQNESNQNLLEPWSTWWLWKETRVCQVTSSNPRQVCQIVNLLQKLQSYLKRLKINEKEAEDGTIFRRQFASTEPGFGAKKPPLSSIMELIFFKYCFCLSCVAIGKLLQMSCFVMYTKFGFLCVHQPKIAAISLRKIVFDRDEN